MLKRISSGFLELRRALSWSSRADASGPNQNEDGQNASAPAAPAAPIVADSEERKEFDKTLDIVYPSAELPLELPELPYALPGGYSVDAEGHLRAYANTGFVSDETPEFHSTLRQNPGVAAAIKSLHIVLQGPQEIDLTKRDSTAATQRKGLSEWSKTIPALKNLTKVKISHFSSSAAAVDGEDVIYVPGEDEAEKGASAEEKGHLDVSAVIKSLAWYAEDLNLVELEGVDFTEEAAKAFEGSKVASLKLEACPTRVSSVIPRLSKLSEIIVTEKGDFSVGCDYIGLLNHVKGTLTAVALNLRDSKIDLQEFTTSLSGAPLTIIGCSFASTPELTAEEIEQKLKDAFPTFGRPAGEEKLTGEDESSQQQQPPQSQQHQVEPSSESTATTVFSTPVKKGSESDDMELDSTTGGISGSDAEMGMLSERNSGTSTPTRKALKRSALVERRKEELKAAELASSKDKLSKITGTGSVPRKLRSTPSRHK
ncbi:hypothetical protein FRC05_003445 [Tulasnella sp. 425]|nr:hypothetical protein FRC05_003445 [Tulasnella sp. 425]